jgi:endonuclease YncB( thermonuclease family)
LNLRWLFFLASMVSGSATAETISGTVVTIIDGDTLVVQDSAKKRYTVRLAEIDAPEPKQAFHLQSARSLASICHRKSAKLEWTEQDNRRRYLAYVTCDGKDANAEQLKRGMAWGSPRATRPTASLYELEAYARLRRIGLWKDENAIAPWEFARKKP